eukprot:g18991.t1
MSANGVTPFFDSVMQQGVLEKNEFAFYFNMEEAATAVSTLEATTSGASAMKGLDHMATTKSRNTSPPPMNALFWGGVDEHFYEAPIRRYNVTQEHYWSLDLLQFRVGNEVYDVETGKHLKNAHRLEGGDTSSGLLAAGMNSEGEMAEGIDAEGGINDEQEDGFGASIIDSVFPSMEDIFGSSPFGSTAIVDGDVHEITIRPFTLDGELAREQEELKNAASTSFFETTETSARLHHAKLVVDTGTTYFTAGKHLYATLRDRLPPVPCSEISSTKYPPLVYVLENSETGQYEELLIPQEIYMVTDESDNCDLAFMEIDLPEGYGPGMLLGEVFMRHYFTVFTREDGAKKPTVGFAHAKVGNGPLERLRQLTADSKPSFSSASPGGG